MEAGANRRIWVRRSTAPRTKFRHFVAADGASLYFASDRKDGLGGYDIYLSKRLDDSWLRWSPAQNLGPDVNTDQDEANLTVDGSGRYAFLSAGQSGAEDIYVFDLAPEMRPVPVAFVRGRAHEPDGKQVAARITYERLSDGVGAREANADRETGRYQVALPIGEE
jgi:OmpA-OmpF porin, OOP family